ncbi:GIY-YIG nuclease family protein [Planktomarina temperata]|nr:GIY-YIG nuclease family protein [Planktomarina temperata]
MAGFVYVMSNPAFDGRVKIGKSIKDPTADRVSELNNTTAVPEPFKVEYYCYVDNFDEIETKVHRLLSANRPNRGREFFHVEVNYAVETIQTIANELGGIKFEEFYFDQAAVTDLKSNSSLALEADNGSKGETKLTAQYPKAIKVLEYNLTAQNYFDKLSNISDDAVEEFLLFLEETPNISEAGLHRAMNFDNFIQYFKPFDEILPNYFYALSLTKNKNMAQEFKSDFALLGPSISAKNIYVKLCKKYQVEVDHHHFAGAVFFNNVAETIDTIQSSHLDELEELLEEIGIDLSNGSNGYAGTYTLRSDGIILIENLSLDGLSAIVKGGHLPELTQRKVKERDQKKISQELHSSRNYIGTQDFISPRYIDEKNKREWSPYFILIMTFVIILIVAAILS